MTGPRSAQICLRLISSYLADSKVQQAASLLRSNVRQAASLSQQQAGSLLYITLSQMKILSIVEATTINAVAKNVLEFYRSARELRQTAADFPIIESSIVTFERSSDDGGAHNIFVTTAREQRLDVEIIPERRRFDLSVLPALRSVVERQRPDLVVSHSVKSHFLVWRSHIWRDFPWIAFHHGYTTTDRKMRIYNRLDRWSLPVADRLVTVCHAFAEELASNTGVPIAKMSVQHNSIRARRAASLADAQALRLKLGIGTGESVLLAVGRLSKEKAHIDLLTAFARLRETNHELRCKLIIVGDGPEQGMLEAAARSKGIHADLIFTGQESDVQPFYAAADVFVLPSHSEGSPNVLLEAMAANLPIVATAVGGVPEIVENNESALLVPANDPNAMAAAIARLLSEEDLGRRLTTHAAALVATRHTPENYVRSLTKIYRDVINRRTVNQPSR
jgi:glycosyltransferase involved in cell wall biosynthesis